MKKVKAATSAFVQYSFDIMKKEDEYDKWHYKLVIRHPVYWLGIIDTVPGRYDSSADSDKSEAFGVIPYAKITVCDQKERHSNIPNCTYTSDKLRALIYCLPTNQLFSMGFHMIISNNDRYCLCPCAKTAMKP